MNNRRTSLFLFIALLLCNSFSYALVTLPSIFGDNMVLQQQSTVKIWGWAKPFEEIKVNVGWDTTTYKVMTGNTMVWEVTVPTPEASFTPYEITVEGWRKLTLKNVLVGEVWICSGQSNMEWSPRLGIVNAEQEIAAASYPNIRFFSVVPRKSTAPQDDVYGEWTACTPETMIDFSAIGYFFARRLQKELNVPIGIINSTVGGSPVETWTPAEVIANDETLKTAAALQHEVPWSPVAPGYLYNAMIHPLTNFKIKGFLWYQGEANEPNPQYYTALLKKMIDTWRDAWNDPQLPFLFAQIAPFAYETKDVCPAIQFAQLQVAQTTKRTGIVITNDFVDDVNNIHPKDKQTAGLRFANLALWNVYKQTANLRKHQVHSPAVRDAFYDQKNPNVIHVAFSNADMLRSTTKKIDGFELAGSDGVFYPAKAEIANGSTVKLSSAKVKNPAQVRYAWSNTAQPSLRNEENMPVSCFWKKEIGKTPVMDDLNVPAMWDEE